MHFESLQFDVRDGVAHVTLCRESAANAIDLQLARELMHAAIRCDEDPAVRAVLLGARGKLFCAGGDLGAFSAAGDGVPALLKEMTIHLHAAISRFASMRAPVLAAVGGSAAGAGFSLVCAADLVICSESAKFTMAYTKAGLTPDGSSTYYLPRIVGPRRALELMVTNRVLAAREALEWGIVNRIVADEALRDESEAWAGELARSATVAIGGVKKLLLLSGSSSLETQMERESEGIADAARTADAREGMKAFFEKRAPHFAGR